MGQLKILFIKLCRICLRVFYIFPIKENRVYLTAYRGTKIGCNPYYIYTYLKEKYPRKYEFIWEYEKKKEQNKNSKIKFVRHGSLKSFLFLLTSKYIFSNVGLGSFIPKRREQIFVNTWHGGGAYKRVGIDISDHSRVDEYINFLCAKQTDYFLSSSSVFTEVMSQAKCLDKSKFLECGMPRNDWFFGKEKPEIREKICNYYGIPNENKILLYAPTFRGGEENAKMDANLDLLRCCQALNNRFSGEWNVLVRMHHFVKTDKYESFIDAGQYPDMQELLYAADVLITDYSSSMWDYSLLYKPGFLFVPDLEQYRNERSFYTDPVSWPFSLAKTNDELEQEILQYDYEFAKKKIEMHHEKLGNKECGISLVTIDNVIMKNKEI